MTFRAAKLSDASSLAALSIEVWLGTYIKHGVNAFFADFALAEFTASNFEAILSDPDELVIVSEMADGIAGYIRVSFGKALLAQAFRHCRNRAVKKVWLATNSDNTPAIEFYLLHGFRRIGQTDFTIGDQRYPNDVFIRVLEH
ncbi:GNAT family N-acetyltransferase [Aliiroseovarius sp. M344]|uniref:GNAT family N-acetyltransferase n=1 Tax=Aliiroseovarius sp. M344 TaxID=2867010 RepID=UPI0021AD8F25|nr:GNAT family N-acetyltransferase [Aliiroseovarius sp. M344]UWQ14957.1 GNAT family N-acetyltransferase [Aliiroseovarius sp. M344]